MLSIGSAQSFAQSNLARAVSDGDQHNVDNSDCAQRQRYQAHRSEKCVHGIEDLADGFRGLDRIPFVVGIGIQWVESVITPDHLVYFLLRQQCATRVTAAGS